MSKTQSYYSLPCVCEKQDKATHYTLGTVIGQNSLQISLLCSCSTVRQSGVFIKVVQQSVPGLYNGPVDYGRRQEINGIF